MINRLSSKASWIATLDRIIRPIHPAQPAVRGEGVGFIIDYVGVLQKALDLYGKLADFDESDLPGTVIPVTDEVAKLPVPPPHGRGPRPFRLAARHRRAGGSSVHDSPAARLRTALGPSCCRQPMLWTQPACPPRRMKRASPECGAEKIVGQLRRSAVCSANRRAVRWPPRTIGAQAAASQLAVAAAAAHFWP
jgi:hypothetical protein